MADKIKEKMNQLRAEAENAIQRAEAAEARVKEYENQARQRENEALSLKNKISLLEQVRNAAHARAPQIDRISTKKGQSLNWCPWVVRGRLVSALFRVCVRVDALTGTRSRRGAHRVRQAVRLQR